MTDIGDLTGKQLGHFKILRKLGAGGMAVVYKAHEMSLNRTVALKVIASHLMKDPSFVERFQREAQAAARINHPNIVQIYSIGEDDGLHYFAMEYIDGKSVEEVIAEEGFLTVPKALPITRQVAAALAEAHDEDIVHRDIKPANIMIDRSGRVRVADFGIAFMQTEAARLTQDGAWVGTPKYVSPEQCRGEDVDGRSDIYSLGVTLYEMLSGQAPFDAKTPAGLVMQIVKGKSEPIRKVNPTVPGEVGELIGRMIALDPADRFQSAGDLALEIEQMEKKGLTTAAHQVHPEAVAGDLSPTVAMDPDDADADREAPTEIVDSREAATEVVKTDPGETRPAAAGPESAPVSGREDPVPEAAGAADDASGSRGSDKTASSPTPEPESERRQPSAEAPAPAAGAAESTPPGDEGSRWSRMGLVAAGVVILALIGVVFAVQLSGASRSEETVADEASIAPEEPVADADEVADMEEPAAADRAPTDAAAVEDDDSADAADRERSGATGADPDDPEAARADAAGSTAPVSTEEAGTPETPEEPARDAVPAGDTVAEGPVEADSPTRDDAATGDAPADAAAPRTPSMEETGAEAAPEPSLPPADSIVLTTTAEGSYGDLVHSLVEGRLLQEEFDVVDAGSFPGERMADLARVLLETTISVTGQERVSAYGVTVDKVTVSLGIRAVSLVDGRTLTTTTDTVTYTPNDAEQRLEAAVSRLMRDTVREIRERTGG